MREGPFASRRWMPVATVLLTALSSLLAGCATSISSTVVSANLAQEEAANKLLVLNIARAHERMPMHFSQLGQIRSAPGMWGLGVPGLELAVPFGSSVKADSTLTGKVDGQTPVDVVAVSNQEFMRGITAPLKPDLMAHFVAQGWPKAMLMHLVFEAVEVTKGDKVLSRLHNDPGSPAFSEFKAFVDAASACDLVFKTDDASSVELTSPAASFTVEEAVAIGDAKLSLRRVTKTGTVDRDPKENDHFLVVLESEDLVLELRGPAGDPAPTSDGQCAAWAEFAKKLTPGADSSTVSPSTMRASNARHSQSRSALAWSPRRQPEGSAEGSSTLEIGFVMRSPQSILYYLGQLSRAQNARWYVDTSAEDPGPLTIHAPHGGRAALFRMTKGDDVTPAVTVEYAGHTFRVPRFNGDPKSTLQDHSVSVLSLLTLVMGLQDKGSDPPGVSNVRVYR